MESTKTLIILTSWPEIVRIAAAQMVLKDTYIISLLEVVDVRF